MVAVPLAPAELFGEGGAVGGAVFYPPELAPVSVDLKRHKRHADEGDLEGPMTNMLTT